MISITVAVLCCKLAPTTNFKRLLSSAEIHKCEAVRYILYVFVEGRKIESDVQYNVRIKKTRYRFPKCCPMNALLLTGCNKTFSGFHVFEPIEHASPSLVEPVESMHIQDFLLLRLLTSCWYPAHMNGMKIL